MSENQDNRVLSRLGARELSEEEAGLVTGSSCPDPKRCTLTLCSVDASGHAFDGDAGECS